MKALDVRVGALAADRLAREGWHPELVHGLIGASGGPKWLILGRLDRALYQALLAKRESPLTAVGSSIGSWRHAMLAQDDPIAAYDRFEEAYLAQHYTSAKPSIAEVTAVSDQLLQAALGSDGPRAVANHSWMHSHIVTARGRGLTNATAGPGLALGLGVAALGNAVTRATLSSSFERVVFSHTGYQSRALSSLAPLLSGFNTRHVELTDANVAQALKASGAIPYLFDGVTDVPGGPRGAYWDGGIIDYHFDLRAIEGDDLWLYPHFGAGVTRGWFDKFLPWRAGRRLSVDPLIMLCPSEEFLAQLPHRKIPDRRDFGRMPEVERARYWHHCVAESQRLADEFIALVTGSDPLAGVSFL
ncbi:MAG: patatin-like phospholipase family protein [Halieaceae bacterium]